MRFTLFGFVIDKLDGIFGISIGTISTVYYGPRGLLHINYQEHEWDWDFLFLHSIYRWYFSRNKEV